MADLIELNLKRSRSKCTAKQLGTLQGLGLRRRGATKVLLDTPEIRGMIVKVQHLVDVRCFSGDDALRDSARLRKQGSAS